MGNHPSFSATGPSASFQPKTTDTTDSTVGGTVVPHNKLETAAGPVELATPLPVRMGVPTTMATTLVTVDFTASGDQTLVAASVAQTTRLYRALLTVSGATTLTFKRGTTVLGKYQMPSAGALAMDFSAEPWFTTATNEALVLSSSNSVTVQGNAWVVTSA